MLREWEILNPRNTSACGWFWKLEGGRWFNFELSAILSLNILHSLQCTCHTVWMVQANDYHNFMSACVCMAGFWDSNQGSENNVSSLQKNNKPATFPADEGFFSEHGHGAKTNLLDNSSGNLEQYMWYFHFVLYYTDLFLISLTCKKIIGIQRAQNQKGTWLANVRFWRLNWHCALNCCA